MEVTGTANKRKGYFQWNATAPDKNGNSQVKATLSDITITATTVTTLPEWSGYDSASEEDKATWDNFLTGLKDHEEGHVEINMKEAEQMKADIEAVLPGTGSISFTSKPSSAGAEAKSRLNFQQVDAAVRKGFQRHAARQLNYDNVSNHVLSPAELKERGIDY